MNLYLRLVTLLAANCLLLITSTKDSFVLVHVNISETDKSLDLTKTHKIPLEKGVPAVAVLSSDGELIYSSGDGEFEAARTMMRKDLVAFLTRWKEGK